jgi:hypothetical protein
MVSNYKQYFHICNILQSNIHVCLPMITYGDVKYYSQIGSTIGLHETNGSPVVPSGQLQVGMWLTTSQRALCPQVPGQGSIQR